MNSKGIRNLGTWTNWGWHLNSTTRYSADKPWLEGTMLFSIPRRSFPTRISMGRSLLLLSFVELAIKIEDRYERYTYSTDLFFFSSVFFLPGQSASVASPHGKGGSFDHSRRLSVLARICSLFKEHGIEFFITFYSIILLLSDISW